MFLKSDYHLKFNAFPFMVDYIHLIMPTHTLTIMTLGIYNLFFFSANNNVKHYQTFILTHTSITSKRNIIE